MNEVTTNESPLQRENRIKAIWEKEKNQEGSGLK